MSETNNGGPAFPVMDEAEEHGQHYGMTLRDYFAAMAMQGNLANSWQAKELDDICSTPAEQMELIADVAYAVADAMIKARGK